MKVCIVINEDDRNELFQLLENLKMDKNNVISDKGTTIEIIMDPSKFRPISQNLKDKFKKSSIEVIDAILMNKEVISFLK